MKKPISEIYLIVHPFYNHNGDYWKSVCEHFLKLWIKSIEQSGKNENSYGILVKSSAPNVPKDYVNTITRHFKKSFPWRRRSILQNLDGTPVTLYKPFLFYDTSDIKQISVRGVYVNQCVTRALRSLLDCFSIPDERAHIDFYESDTGDLPDGFQQVETRYNHEGSEAKLVLPSSRLSLEEKIHHTQLLLT